MPKTAALTGPDGEDVWIEEGQEPCGEARYVTCRSDGKRQMCNDLWQAMIYVERLRDGGA